MRRVDKTKDELIDELMELEENEIKNYFQYVRLLQKIYEKIKNSRNEEVQQEKEYYKRKLIEKYIFYGTFLKSEKKDEKAAADNLEKAIKLKRDLPIAYYRLGFLAYGRREYAEALQYFNQAIEFQSLKSSSSFLMNEQQLYFAHLYLCNSALYVAEMAQQQVENFSEREGLKKRLQNVEMSPFYEQIRQNEQQIYGAAYRVVTNEEDYTCSWEEAYDAADKLVEQAVVLMFSREANTVKYKRSDTKVLTLENAEMLRYFFLKTDDENLAVRHVFEELIGTSKVTGRVSKDAYRQRISRLNQNLREIGITERLIESRQMYDRAYRDVLAEEDRETGYYYNGLVPFAVIYQTSDSFLLDEEW